MPPKPPHKPVRAIPPIPPETARLREALTGTSLPEHGNRLLPSEKRLITRMEAHNHLYCQEKLPLLEELSRLVYQESRKTEEGHILRIREFLKTNQAALQTELTHAKQVLTDIRSELNRPLKETNWLLKNLRVVSLLQMVRALGEKPRRK